MFSRLSFFMLSMFLLGANVNAEWISFSNSKTNNLNSSFRQAPVITKSIEGGNIRMNIKISGFEAEEVSDNGQKYTKIDLLSESASHLLPGYNKKLCCSDWS